jgi:hypothetical protein
MRKAVEDKFGGLNLRKLSDLSTVTERFGKQLGLLTKDVNLEPISRFLDRIFKALDESTVTGQALKQLFEGLATAFGASLEKNGDWIEYGLKEAIIWSLDLATEVVTLKNKIENAFNDGRSAAEKFNAFLAIVTTSLKVMGAIAMPLFAPLIAAKALTEGAFGVGRSIRRNAAAGASGAPLPANASGGMVTGVSGGIASTSPLPASGEGLASVGVGEAIIPASMVRGGSGAGAPVSFQFGDIVVQTQANEPKAVAKEIARSVRDEILDALEIAGAQMGVT